MQNSYEKPNSIDANDTERRDSQPNRLARPPSLGQARPVSAPSEEISQIDSDQTGPSSCDVADYIADMLQTLEKLAGQNRLDTLSIMISMAREQAEDDHAAVQKRSNNV